MACRKMSVFLTRRLTATDVTSQESVRARAVWTIASPLNYIIQIIAINGPVSQLNNQSVSRGVRVRGVRGVFIIF